jgi:hypothetical protein
MKNLVAVALGKKPAAKRKKQLGKKGLIEHMHRRRLAFRIHELDKAAG